MPLRTHRRWPRIASVMPIRETAVQVQNIKPATSGTIASSPRDWLAWKRREEPPWALARSARFFLGVWPGRLLIRLRSLGLEVKPRPAGPFRLNWSPLASVHIRPPRGKKRRSPVGSLSSSAWRNFQPENTTKQASDVPLFPNSPCRIRLLREPSGKEAHLVEAICAGG